MDGVMSLIVPFIAIAVLSVLIDRVTMVIEGIMHRIPHFPDNLEWYSAYFIVLFIAYSICYFGDFGFFVYLDFRFIYRWMDYLMTAFMISGGSIYLRKQFSTINELPSIISGITSSIKSVFFRR